ncbi:DNA polymerase subunit Cdc27 [Microdochium nivale]|nr:DNA polymerase subunit Cdc27 [Microdochium nivale]
MDDYRQYLAQQVLTEDKLVTYRVLSRALKVHVNTAKEMLFEFHKWQNDKRPGSLHATYLIYGTKKLVDEEDGDVDMTSSQMSEESPPVRFSDDVLTETLSLVKQEELEDMLAEYDEVRSLHMYSVGPHPLKDMQLLADTSRQVFDQSAADDTAALAKTYGTIFNPYVRRRERRGAALKKPAQSAPAPASKGGAEPSRAVKQEPPATETKSAAIKEEPPAAQPASTKSTASAATKRSSAAAAPSLKRQGSSSGIGQMFAKAAAKPKKPVIPKQEEKPSPAMSDDGQDDDGDDQPMEDAKPEDEATSRRSRSNRQAALRQMMDESDEEQESSAAPTPAADDPMDEDEAAPAEPEAKADESAEEVTSTENGRKRGRRRVTKKKQVMDDQGYLVTIQEQGWESFSEDEAPPATKVKTTAAATTTATSATAAKTVTAAKPKKAVGKAGQGNIMSFFGKK